MERSHISKLVCLFTTLNFSTYIFENEKKEERKKKTQIDNANNKIYENNSVSSGKHRFRLFHTLELQIRRTDSSISQNNQQQSICR